MNRSVLVAILTLAGSAALAADVHYSATLAQPLAARKEVIAGENIWRCSDSTCVLSSKPTAADTVRTCHELARQVGELTAYGAEGNQFDAAKLAKCNGH